MMPEAGRRVEVAGGLVGQEDQGAVDEGPGHRHPLLLATGELAGEVVALLGQADEVEHLGDLGGDHVLGPADDLEGEGHVLEDGLVGQEPEVLEDAADVAPQVRDAPLGQVADLLAGLPDATGVGHLLAEQEADEGRLAGAGRADQEHELALVDLDGAVLEGDRGSLVRLGDVLEFDHGKRRCGEPTTGRPRIWQQFCPLRQCTRRRSANWVSPSDLRRRVGRVARRSTAGAPPSVASDGDQSGRGRRSALRRSSASISVSRSPSSTASTLPVSALVRRSLTSWYGAIT